MIIMLKDLTPDQEQLAGGKGGALARLLRSGYPVPDGFVVLTSAFTGDEIKPEAWETARQLLVRLRRGGKDPAFAVRSSCGGEDSAQASYAGEFETVLDVRTDAEIRAAIGTVRRSRNAERVEAYGEARGLAPVREMAVVVQRLVRAEYSGVLFTADPVGGNLMQMTGNGVRGMGEKLVSGKVNPLAFSFDRPGGKYHGPEEFKPFAGALYRLGERLDRDGGVPQDIEWAAAGGKVFILQTRPITTMREFNPVTGEVNATCTGDFLWSNGNAAEIQPEVMTLLTWSVSRLWGEGYSRWWSRYPVQGNIGGRCYFNISVQVAPFADLPGIGLKRAMGFVGDWWGRIPQDRNRPPDAVFRRRNSVPGDPSVPGRIPAIRPQSETHSRVLSAIIPPGAESSASGSGGSTPARDWRRTGAACSSRITALRPRWPASPIRTSRFMCNRNWSNSPARPTPMQ